jgi:hypothetical protein
VAIWAPAHPAIDLGGDDDLVATGEILDRAAEDFLAAPEGVAVRGVEEIDAGSSARWIKGRLSSSPSDQAWLPWLPPP